MSESEPRLSGESRALLEELPFLRELSEDARRLVVESFVPVSFGFGGVVFAEGDEPDGFYVLVSGAARVLKQRADGGEVTLNTLGPGDAFGELGLLTGEPRSATVRASGESTALKLDRSLFAALVQVHPELGRHFDRQIARHRRRDLFKLSSAFAGIPGEALEALLDALEPVEVTKGETVVRQGDPSTCMYVVEEGRLHAVWQTGEGTQGDVAYLRRGDFFGERSLLLGAPRAVTVDAVTNARLLALQEGDFRRFVDESEAFRAVVEGNVERYEFKFAARVPLDFAQELLPAEAAVAPEPVSEEQAEDAPGVEEAEEWAGAEEPPQRRIRRFKHVWQVDEMDCGAACLAMATRHFGRPVSLAHIRKLVHTGTDGTSLAGIVAGAQSLGLRARAVKASKSRLPELPKPAIAHVGGNHWVTVYDADERSVRIADPALGLVKQGRKEFEDRWSGYTALLAYGEGLEEAPLDGTQASWIWQFFRPYRKGLAIAAVLALVAAALEMALPVFTQIIVDDVLVNGDRRLLYMLLVAMLGVLVAMTGATLIQRYILARAAVTLDGTTLDFLTQRMLALPMSYFNSRRTGDIQRRLAGMRQVRTFMVQDGVEGLTAAATLAAALTLMFIYDWVLALVFLAMTPAYAWLMRFSRKRLRPMFDSLEEAFGKYHSHQIDAIKGIETVKAVGAEQAFRTRMLDQFTSLAKRLFRADFTIMSYEAATQIVSFASLILFLFVGALRVLGDDMTIGELVAFNALVLLANGPILVLLSIGDELQYGQVLLNLLNDFIEQEPEQGGVELTAIPTLEGRVELKELGFRYSPISPPILEGISLEVPAGATVAIVGRSGSGKTTLVRCLSGLLEPTSGTILFDGVDMRTLAYR
ncbi:MAG: cyclic nucleotide-binding domain-containing protein, partial [Actinomycetota bacterium]|nr:cyclic nucleotide-binding domain-containing protein [Actinomycetota bacterium]